MARAIDGTKATKEVMEYSRKLHEAGNVDAAGYVMWAASIVDEQPTIEAEPVKHGKWLKPAKKYPYWDWKCSECGCEEYRQSDSNGEYRVMNYCPNCGAKMDKE